MENETNIILLVVVTSLIFFLLVLAIITFTALYNRHLVKKDNEIKMTIKEKEVAVLRTAIETQTTERESLAHKLHDEVGPLLSTLKLKFFQNQKTFKAGNMDDAVFQSDREFLDSIIQIVRNVSHELSPSFVIKFGVARGIENFMMQLKGINCTLDNHLGDTEELPKTLSGNLYLIITELINNLIKHEQITQLNVSLESENNQLFVRIDHDGEGFTDEEFDIFEEKSEGLGLTSIKNRAVVIDGVLNFRKSPESPKIEIITPLQLQ